MVDLFLFVGLPYLALTTAVVVGIRRARSSGYQLSTRSSQFLEDRKLLWGSAPWHIGIGIIFFGHLFPLLFPTLWSSFLTVPGALLVIETIGVAASLLAILGLIVLIVRRVVSSRLQAVTTTMDLVVVGLLLAQVVIGLIAAVQFRYGAAWSTGTLVPYIWSLVRLQPDTSYVVDLPALFRLHVVGAWLILLLLPFTRLMHIIYVPVHYLFRAPLRVIWSTERSQPHAVAARARAESRREFIKGAVGGSVAASLLALGVSEKLFNFFRGPRPDLEAESALLAKKLQRLQLTAEERALELERQRSEMILIGHYSELNESKGKYFIDFRMAPGLAFKGKDGLPLLISAKCTHLGCTVGSEVDEQGRVLCPCHISYFDIYTGEPNAGSPAKAPLPHLGWALVDATGNVVARKAADRPVQGTIDTSLLPQCSLYITKPSLV